MTSGMTISAFEPTIVPPLMSPGLHQMAMSRPQVGIERLPTRRLSNEPRESMNCKSCRKRKIKCNRLRPACEACQVFQCPCIYDAVPKKRGPKTDVLEALLKRVDGLEQRLKDQKKEDVLSTTEKDSSLAENATAAAEPNPTSGDPKPKIQAIDTRRPVESDESAIFSPTQASEPSPGVHVDALLDTYFTRFHAKPFHILDESSVRQRLQLNQVPTYLVHAIYAVAARYTPHPSGYQSAVKLSQEYAARARAEIDTDEPSVDALQALLLLVTAFTAAGKGRKAYMLLTNAVGMAMALELHREMDAHARVTAVEREMRRRIFWTCYLLDRFMASGSKRPSLIADKTLLLRLPCWSPNPATLPMEGEFFQNGSNLQCLQGSGKKSQGSSGMLIDITRILGITNRYLASGGVKGDSHFPWHSLSSLSKIRHDLDIWASGTQEVCSSLDTLFGQPDSTVLVLSKLIYHLIHCLIYRPFLPIDLAELAVIGQHQSWQIEATNLCFLHANAIAELVEVGKQNPLIEWPAFVGYCICTAGTVHIHGAQYDKKGIAGEMNVFSSSAEFLSREMQQLSELRYAWANVQHQRETLQGIYNAHSELVKNIATNPMRHSPAFQLEDFFDRYANVAGPGSVQAFSFDAANLSLSDVIVEFTADAYTGHDLYAPRVNGGVGDPSLDRPSLKRKKTAPPILKRLDANSRQPLAGGGGLAMSQSPLGLATPAAHGRQSFSAGPFHPHPHPSPAILQSPATLSPHHHNVTDHDLRVSNAQESINGAAPPNSATVAAAAAAAAAGFPLGPSSHPNPGMSSIPNAQFSPQYNYTNLPGGSTAAPPAPSEAPQNQPSTPGTSSSMHSYDPMFGAVPTNAFSSPAAWHGDEASTKSTGTILAHSPDGRSNHGSTDTGPGEEKDPFLSLLEQLAENENARGAGNELDFFLTGAPNGP